ncbi:uncharacterized protein [Dermacentor andersoni]|uniref:uncharacterized protein n=1 Tax=Dermacentor andersoni TaxID=34620 RepID=UPI0021555411|nr:uncharacterized protein LOC126516770 [Dermacentor andersoni]XP_054919864.1 uncharacterized protein LOC126516770 [Dermacentor andersoni]
MHLAFRSMKVWSTVLGIILSSTVTAGNLPEQNKVLHDLFANIGPNDLPLEDSYFTIREDGAPKNSTLYRFNMTNGFLRDLHRKLAPKFHEEYCKARLDPFFNSLGVNCALDLEGTLATYDASLSYGASVVHNFSVNAVIIKHSGINPPLLSVYTYGNTCKTNKCQLHGYDIYITAFELNTTASPRFRDLTSNPKFQNFKKNQTLAQEVWTNFNVKMYTHILPIIVKTLNVTYRSEIPKRMAKVGALDKTLFRLSNRRLAA